MVKDFDNNEPVDSTYFFIHGERLSKEFNSLKNADRRKTYRQAFTKYEQYRIFSQWQNMLNKNKTDIPFLDYIENIHIDKHKITNKELCTTTKIPELNDKDTLIKLINNLEDPQLKLHYNKKLKEILPTLQKMEPIILNQNCNAPIFGSIN